jgi:hypothetical protein
MTAEIRLIIGTKEARLILKKGDDILEDELWKFDRQIGRSEAGEIVRVCFDDAYDLMQWTVHGD